MKIKVSEEWIEQNNGRNTHLKYNIRVSERHLLSAVAFDVADLIFFVLLLSWLFENKRRTTMKMKISGEWTEQNNGRNARRKYVIRGF